MPEGFDVLSPRRAATSTAHRDCPVPNRWRTADLVLHARARVADAATPDRRGAAEQAEVARWPPSLDAVVASAGGIGESTCTATTRLRLWRHFAEGGSRSTSGGRAYRGAVRTAKAGLVTSAMRVNRDDLQMVGRPPT